MTTVDSIESRVESLVGEPGRIRAPRGSRLNARSWSTEAPLRMLLNNLDPEVAERPGGARRLRRLREGGAQPGGASSARPLPAAPGRGRDAARPERQARRRVPDARGRAASADRELAARAAVGDLGRVSPARGARADDVRADDGRELDLHRHPGNPPGHLPDVRRGRRDALRVAGPRGPDDSDGGTRAAWAARSRLPGRWPEPRCSASRSTRSGFSVAWTRGISTRRWSRSTRRWLAFAQRRGRGGALSVGLLGNAAEVVPELARRGEPFDLVTDQTAAHDPLTGYVPAGARRRRGRRRASRETDPETYLRRARDSIATHVRGLLEFVRRRKLRFRLRQQSQR